ncbi:MAG: hypothetical protein HYZ48_02810 [Chlamydiales bacterium]|nr:hypothetical protein [Chlamydiales bacterium]
MSSMFDVFSSLKKKGKIEIFVRYCHYSAASAHKKRFAGFDKRKCFDNLLKTIDPKRVEITFFLDTHYPAANRHFIQEQSLYPVLEMQAGCEAISFLKMLDHVVKKPLKPETIIYFLEDDYVHRPGWLDILEEGLSIPSVDYVTLFDHRDKYSASAYAELHSKLFYTKSCHWRSTPSTTNTYAMRFETLLKHEKSHRKFSQDWAERSRVNRRGRRTKK